MSRLVTAPKNQTPASQLIKAVQMWYPALNDNTVPNGMFDRFAQIECSGFTITSNDLDFEFDIPFDDDIEADEAEITIYNLAMTTLQSFNINNAIVVKAGYKDDIGVIFQGRINAVKTKKSGTDRVTTISAIDDAGLSEYDVNDISFTEGVRASYILKSLLDRLSIPVAVFNPVRDHIYESAVNISGAILGNIKKYAEVCGIAVYFNKGQVFARRLSEGDNIGFTVSSDTGLIESPEEFTEENTAEEYVDNVYGYTLRMLIQHRMNTAAIINLDSENAKGTYRVRKGRHTWNESESVTECEVIEND